MATCYSHRGQRTTCRSWGVELRLLELAVSTFSCWAISTAPHYLKHQQHNQPNKTIGIPSSPYQVLCRWTLYVSGHFRFLCEVFNQSVWTKFCCVTDNLKHKGYFPLVLHAYYPALCNALYSKRKKQEFSEDKSPSGGGRGEQGPSSVTLVNHLDVMLSVSLGKSSHVAHSNSTAIRWDTLEWGRAVWKYVIVELPIVTNEEKQQEGRFMVSGGSMPGRLALWL